MKIVYFLKMISFNKCFMLDTKLPDFHQLSFSCLLVTSHHHHPHIYPPPINQLRHVTCVQSGYKTINCPCSGSAIDM